MASTNILQILINAKDETASAFNSLGARLSEASNHSRQFALGLAAAGTTTAIFGYKALQAAADIETQTIGFQTLLGSVEKANDAIKMIQRDAASTPFEFSGLVEANKALTFVTKNAEESEKVLLNVGKALAAAGKGQNELNSVIYNLQQIGNTGKITEMDIRQFGYAGVNILELLASYYGTTKEAAADMVKNSSDAFGDLSKAFEKAGSAGGAYADAFSNAGGSLNQMISNLKDSWAIFLAGEGKKVLDFGKQLVANATNMIQNVFPAVIGKIEELIKWFGENKWAIYAVSGAIMGALLPAMFAFIKSLVLASLSLAPFIIAGGALAMFIYGIKEGNIAITAIGAGILTMFIPAMITMATTLMTTVIPAILGLIVSMGPLLLAGAIVAGVVAGIMWIVKNWEMVSAKAQEIWTPIANFFSGIWNNITSAAITAWNGLTSFLSKAWDAIVGVFKFAAALILGIMISILDWIMPNWRQNFEALINLMSIVWDGIKLVFETALNGIKASWEFIWNGIGNFVSPIFSSVQGSVNNAFDWLKKAFNLIADPLKKAWNFVWDGIKGAVTSAWDAIKDTIKSSINWIIEKINWFIRAANSIAQKGAGAVPGLSIPTIKEIPMLANGGIVMKPTLAMIGEAGPEAVIPLSRSKQAGAGLGGINITITGNTFLDERAAEKMGDMLINRLGYNLKLGF